MPPAPSGQRANFVPRSIEDQVRYAYHTPAPGDYDAQIPAHYRQVSHGKISNAKVLSTLDHPAKYTHEVPGPGHYETPDKKEFPLPEGGRLNRKPPQEKIQLNEYPIPGPADHGIPADPTEPRAVYGTFGKDPRHAEYIRQEVLRSRLVPAPGQYEATESFEAIKPFCPEGGRLLHAGKQKHYFDQAPKLTEGNPDPGTYSGSFKPAVNAEKAAGRVVYRYESATMAESKRIVNRAIGDSNSAPGPGTYTLPDPPPLHEVPTLKGRSLGHGMPPPFNYNCAPDHGLKFAPVRQQNSGDQIFGRDFKRGAMSGKKESRPSSAGRSMSIDELGNSVGQNSTYPPDSGVQWRSGGFAGVKKSKSAGMIRAAQPEHVSVLEAAAKYKPLDRKHRDPHSFLPNATRKNNGHVPISTKKNSREIQSLQQRKAQLAAFVNGIQLATSAALEPLDEEKLKQQALEGLVDKAVERMRLEGVANYQQQMVLDELPRVLEERSSKHLQPQDDLGAESQDALMAAA